MTDLEGITLWCNKKKTKTILTIMEENKFEEVNWINQDRGKLRYQN